MNNRKYVLSAGKFVSDQLEDAGLSLDNPEIDNLIDLAGGGLSITWLQRLIDGKINKLTIRQLIGLRRMLGEPIDTIIGLPYNKPANQSMMAGLSRIRKVLGGRYNKGGISYLSFVGDCQAVIIIRIQDFSTWAVTNDASSLDTSADDIRNHLKDTFSVPVLVSLKYALHTNIDDICGLGSYDPEAEFLAGKAIPEALQIKAALDNRKAEEEKRSRAIFLRDQARQRDALKADRANKLEANGNTVKFVRYNDTENTCY